MKTIGRAHRMQGVLTRIVASYLAIAFLIVLCVLVISNQLFHSKMETEIESFNRRMIEKTADDVEKGIFDVVQNAYLDLVWQEPVSEQLGFFASHPAEGNHAKLWNVYRLLQSVVARNSAAISSIHVYYPQTGVFLSSSYGYKSFDEEELMRLPAFAWVGGDVGAWVGTRPVPDALFSPADTDGIELMDELSFVGRYKTPGAGHPCLISINVRETTLRNVLRKVLPYDYARTCVLSPSGTVLSSTAAEELYQAPEDYQEFVHAQGAVHTVRGDSVVSAVPLARTGWRLCSVISQRDFYASSRAMQRGVFLAGAGVFLAAALLTGYLSRRIYGPIKALSLKAASHMEIQVPPGSNEYAIIDAAIDHFMGRVNRLQVTLKLNAPAIQYDFVAALLGGKLSEAEAGDRLDGLGLRFLHPHFACAIVSLAGKAFQDLPFTERQSLQYDIVERLGADPPEGALVLTRPYAGDRIVAVINAPEAGDGVFGALARRVRGMLDAPLPLCIACGEWQTRALDLPESYRALQKLLTYHFFYPDTVCLHQREFLPLEGCEARPDAALLEDFESALASFDRARVAESLGRITGALTGKAYSAAVCHAAVLKTLSCLSNFKKSLQIEQVRQLKRELYDRFGEIDDITQFARWVDEYVDRLFSAIQEQDTLSKNRELVERIRAYIPQHLGEDLSLEAIAARFYISQKHLCKVFKAESGETLTEFITRTRMRQARDLLQDERLSVEQVGTQLGYNSPSYFIKKFKEFYGVTPKRYRIDSAGRTDDNIVAK